MKLENCVKCTYFIDARADCVLCKYNDELEHRVVDNNKVISCPRDSH